MDKEYFPPEKKKKKHPKKEAKEDEKKESADGENQTTVNLLHEERVESHADGEGIKMVAIQKAEEEKVSSVQTMHNVFHAKYC